MQSDLLAHWDGNKFGKVIVRLSEYISIEVCVASYAFLAGLKGSSCQRVIQRIKNGVPLAAPVAQAEEQVSAAEQSKRTSLEYTLLRQYERFHAAGTVDLLWPAPSPPAPVAVGGSG